MAAPLTETELKALSALFAEMAEEFEDHGTNDHLLPGTAPMRALVEATIRYNHEQDRDGLDGPVEKLEGQYFIYDDWLMRYLAHRTEPGQKALSETELQAAAGLLDILAEDDNNLLVEDERITEVRYLSARCKGKKAPAAAFAGAAPTAPEGVATKDRPGVNERWAKQWKTTLRNHQGRFDAFWPEARDEMTRYVRTGEPPPVPYERTPVKPPFAAWELLNCFPLASTLYLWEWERAGVEEARWDGAAAASAFLANYLMAMAENHTASLCKRRHGKDYDAGTGIQDTPFAALGFVIGPRERAEAVVRLHLAAVRNGWFNRGLVGPTSAFILGLLADYLGEPPPDLGEAPRVEKGKVDPAPAMTKLLEAWRTPDPAKLTPHLVAACDVHTHQSVGRNVEFENGFWTRTPIAVLLVLKLRESLGLKNPPIDHPLTATIVGRLPVEASTVPAEHPLLAVEKRMRKEGFDEKKILAACGAI